MLKTQKIVLTGAESSGKSTLTKALAEYFSLPFVNELARNYVENLNRNYEQSDVLKIAELQIEEERKILKQGYKAVFFDTDLIITKIWLLEVYGFCPNWINEEIKNHSNTVHLLCYYDLPWLADGVRENPNNRDYLFNKYQEEIIKFGFPYKIIKGNFEERFETAKNFVQDLFV